MNPTGFEYGSQKEIFIFPSLENEAGEIERVATNYSPENERDFIEVFLGVFKKSHLKDLTEDVWSQLENTDSFDVKRGDWAAIEEHVTYSNQATGAKRDWRDIKQKMESEEELDAPIILKYDDRYHLVSGNTRLMVARALGKLPQALIVEIKSEQLKNKENHETFLKRLEGRFSKEQIEDIDFAYDIAKEAHRPAVRDGGVRYFEHPRSGCLIMMDELGLYNRDLLISFLLHDVGEDTPMLGNITKSYDVFREKARLRLAKLFGDRVADTVIRLTKPSIENICFHTKQEAYDFYLTELTKSEDAVLLKMVDRLHNLRSLRANKPEKLERQIRETRDVYLPVFETVSGEWKQYAEILAAKIKQQLAILESAQIQG